MAATTQVQILVRTYGSAKALRATRVGPRPGVGSGAAVRSCLRSRVARLAFVAPPHVHAPPLAAGGQHRAGSTELGSCGLHRASFSPSPHRLVVRTSRCGRDNLGSNPGADRRLCEGTPCSPCWSAPWRWELGGCPVLSVQQRCTTGLRGTATCACPSSAAGGATSCLPPPLELGSC